MSGRKIDIECENPADKVMIDGSVVCIDLAAMEHYRSMVIRYLVTMAQARRALARGIVTSDEYRAFEAKIARKYGLDLCSIFRRESLISPAIGGTISHHSESDTDEEDDTP